jgi:hypothetical protein
VTGDLTDDLMSMASMSCQPMADSYDYGPILKLDFQSLKPPAPSDARALGCAARFNLLPVDEQGSMSGHRFQSLHTAGQPLSSACRADLSEDGEISESDDDDDLPSVMKILAGAKCRPGQGCRNQSSISH